MSIEHYIDRLLEREGGYSNHPKDSGGETQWGITIAVARAAGYTGQMKAMPREAAKAIYRQRYWLEPRLDQIDAIHPKLAEKLFDIGANCSPSIGIRFLQRALNLLKGSAAPLLIIDGCLGTETLSALKQFKAARGANGLKVLLAMINAQLSVHYIELAERYPKNQTFIYGWQLNRVLGV
ncbi:glycoside hydrolase family 108 protein [Mycoavidus sp. SF9855]|uniref:glycoside hydrolase family 108 protein n=1 Tax=Mycoavidus sp. SF9855 TaxID=2968475 RepID=UPI00211C71CF|nr:glycosyl hydrolase 108 family protein [Mycoavidus sp. SF9855]UUM20893.1 hypothetical protein NQD60_05265 [Mycoavidus sp. SF9855]